MTLPRQVVPGRDYMITRRCSERRFFPRPDEETNNAFIYCLALAARRAKVEVTFCPTIPDESAHGWFCEHRVSLGHLVDAQVRQGRLRGRRSRRASDPPPAN
jgi:hypothetical protein